MKKRRATVIVGVVVVAVLFVAGCATMAKGGTEADTARLTS